MQQQFPQSQRSFQSAFQPIHPPGSQYRSPQPSDNSNNYGYQSYYNNHVSSSQLSQPNGFPNVQPTVANTSMLNYSYPQMQFNSQNYPAYSGAVPNWYQGQGMQFPNQQPSFSSAPPTQQNPQNFGSSTTEQAATSLGKDLNSNSLNTPQTLNSESSLSSSPEHSASDSSPAGSGAEGGESESADSDTISGNTARSEHLNNQSAVSNNQRLEQQPSVMNAFSNEKASKSVLGRRPAENPGTHSYPTPSWQQSRLNYGYATPNAPVNQQNPVQQQPPSGPFFNNSQTQMPAGFNQPPQAPPPYVNNMPGQFSNLSLSSENTNFKSQASSQPVNLLSSRHILPSKPVEPMKPKLPDHYKGLNCDPAVFRCTLNAIPQKQDDIGKAKLPFGLLIHPFKDLQNLPVIQSPVIVRCKSCRTYINPFVTFVDQRRWKCNMCYRANEVPSDFTMNSNGRSEDVTKRPEITNATVEFIAPGDYMLRPPQAALYLFLLDVSAQAMATGYLDIVCNVLRSNLSNLPGDARTKVSIICFDSAIHYLAVLEDQEKAQLLSFPDIEDLEIPRHDDLLVNLHENMDKISTLLSKLPDIFRNNVQTRSALGSALTAGQKLLASTGGRMTVFQSILPSLGPGKLSSREDPNERAASDVKNLKPATDFYKSLALTCSGNQTAIDLFAINSQYIDLASLSGMSRFCGGSIQTFPNLTPKSSQAERLEKDFTRYLTRKLGFEAVLRVRCTRGLTVSDFFGNFFVRSTDLLAFPNINPDAGVAMKVRIEETLVSASHVCFQAALLYTSSKGERRIRVHTLYIPIANGVQDIVNSADVQAVTCFLSQMAVDRSLDSNISDAREALVNAVTDCLAAYRTSLPGHASMGTMLIAPPSLSLFPLFVSGLLKTKALRVGASTKLDDRLAAMIEMLSMPIFHVMHMIYPPLYPVHNIHHQPLIGSAENSDATPTNSASESSFSFAEGRVPQPPLLQLSAEHLSRDGAYLLDKGNQMILLVRSHVPINWCMKVLDVANPTGIPGGGLKFLPELDNSVSLALRAFIEHLLDSRPNHAPILIIRDDDPYKALFYECLVDDKTESSSSYVEFLQHINNSIIKAKK